MVFQFLEPLERKMKNSSFNSFCKGSIKDKIKGFHCGVDDYLAKPFNLDEFLLRVQRLLAKKAWYIKNNNKNLFNGDAYTFGIK